MDYNEFYYEDLLERTKKSVEEKYEGVIKPLMNKKLFIEYKGEDLQKI